MVCADCGSDNRQGRRFCTNWGSQLNLICAGCEASIDPADKFCGECGIAIAGGVAEDLMAPLDRDPNERRFVAVLFADLISFTEFSEARDHEVVRATLTEYYDRSREVVEGYGGSVQKFIGDAVMAVWGATVAHEDDVERALRAGLELVDMVSRMGADLDGGDLSLRVGVLTGEASVGPATPELGLVVGDLVNTASRQQTIAEPGTVVVSEATYRMLGAAADFEPLGEFPLKGKSQPVAVWRVVRVTTDRSSVLGAAGSSRSSLVARRKSISSRMRSTPPSGPAGPDWFRSLARQGSASHDSLGNSVNTSEGLLRTPIGTMADRRRLTKGLPSGRSGRWCASVPGSRRPTTLCAAGPNCVLQLLSMCRPSRTRSGSSLIWQHCLAWMQRPPGGRASSLRRCAASSSTSPSAVQRCSSLRTFIGQIRDLSNSSASWWNALRRIQSSLSPWPVPISWIKSRAGGRGVAAPLRCILGRCLLPRWPRWSWGWFKA